MTVKLNLTIDEEVVKRAKQYAKKNNISVSAFVADYLDKSTKPKNVNEKNFLEKYAGSLKGQLSDNEVERLKVKRIKEKYGY